jgi:hypothetical protein
MPVPDSAAVLLLANEQSEMASSFRWNDETRLKM